MFKILEKYKNTGSFDFYQSDSLSKVCNAPTDKSGVYIVWNATDQKDMKLLYIGRSGKKENGVIVHRKAGLGGIKDRLVNGHQFGKNPRKRIWPDIMVKNNISRLHIEWYNTEEDDPVEIERELISEVLKIRGFLPEWNNQPY